MFLEQFGIIPLQVVQAQGLGGDCPDFRLSKNGTVPFAVVEPADSNSPRVVAGSATRSTLCTRVIASTTTRSPRRLVPRLDVVRKAHVLRRVLGVPNQLLRQRMFGVEVEIAEKPLAGPHGNAANRADAVLIIARPGRISLRMIHVHLGVFVERAASASASGKYVRPLRESSPSTFTPRITPACRVDAHRRPANRSTPATCLSLRFLSFQQKSPPRTKIGSPWARADTCPKAGSARYRC